MAKKKKGSYCTLSSKYFAFELWAFICRNNQPPCLWGLYSSKLKRETAVCLINVCRAPARCCWIVCFPIFPQDMPPKSTAREKSIGKSQTNVPLWAHACRHKSSIHLQQSVYSYFWGFTGCKYEHRLFDKKRWTNTQVDAIFWARAAAPKLSVINPTLPPTLGILLQGVFLQAPGCWIQGIPWTSPSHIHWPLQLYRWHEGGLLLNCLLSELWETTRRTGGTVNSRLWTKEAKLRKLHGWFCWGEKKNPNQPSDFCHPWVLQVGHLAGC